MKTFEQYCKEHGVDINNPLTDAFQIQELWRHYQLTAQQN